MKRKLTRACIFLRPSPPPPTNPDIVALSIQGARKRGGVKKVEWVTEQMAGEQMVIRRPRQQMRLAKLGYEGFRYCKPSPRSVSLHL